MSEKRFTLEQWTEESLYFSDGEFSAHMSIGYICKKVEKKLNEQQATINELKEENKKLREEWEFSFRTELAHHRVAEKELQEKIREQQATICKLQDLCGESDSENAKLRIENKQLKNKLNKTL